MLSEWRGNCPRAGKDRATVSGSGWLYCCNGKHIEIVIAGIWVEHRMRAGHRTQPDKELMMDPYYWSMHASGSMWISPLLFFFVFILLLMRILAWFSRDSERGEDRETSREILDRRYASGEIAKEQYEQMNRDIE